MQSYLLTILILLPVIGAATALVYGFTPGARESHHRWIALGFTTAALIVSLLLLKGGGGTLVKSPPIHRGAIGFYDIRDLT